MDEREMIQLMEAYGYAFTIHNPKEHRWRFQGSETFIDVWMGRRGVTIAAYDPKKHTMRYQHRITAFTLEDKLIEIRNQLERS